MLLWWQRKDNQKEDLRLLTQTEPPEGQNPLRDVQGQSKKQSLLKINNNNKKQLTTVVQGSAV